MTWYLKQLFPLTYQSRCEIEGNKYFVTWKMWFGRCYKQNWRKIA